MRRTRTSPTSRRGASDRSSSPKRTRATSALRAMQAGPPYTWPARTSGITSKPIALPHRPVDPRTNEVARPRLDRYVESGQRLVREGLSSFRPVPLASGIMPPRRSNSCAPAAAISAWVPPCTAVSSCFVKAAVTISPPSRMHSSSRSDLCRRTASTRSRRLPFDAGRLLLEGTCVSPGQEPAAHQSDAPIA